MLSKGMGDMSDYLKRIGNKPRTLDSAIKSACDIMRRSNCSGAMQYVPEFFWIFFLRILDHRELLEQERAEAVGLPYKPVLSEPYRWRDWASTGAEYRRKLQDGECGGVLGFVNGTLFPHLRDLKNSPTSSIKQKVLSEIISFNESSRIDTERNFCDILDIIDEIALEDSEGYQSFTMSQVYEHLLRKMGEKGNDAGQFFTPREVVRTMVKVVAPRIGETVYDPCCGTCGFLSQSYEFMMGQNGVNIKNAKQLDALKSKTFFGREKDNVIYPIALANLVLQGVDDPRIWHGNTLTGHELYGGLFGNAPDQFDVILTNPPFGGKEGIDTQVQFAYKTVHTQLLFMQHIFDNLKPGGRCGIVIDEGVLFRNAPTQPAFIQVKKKLLNDFNLWCIVSLPKGAFHNAGTAQKTNLLFFDRDRETSSIWYYPKFMKK